MLNGVAGKMIPIIGTMAVLHMSVARLKTIVSAQSGLPVSVFRLSTAAGFELYDCNNLLDYALEVGMGDNYTVVIICCIIGDVI